MKRQGNRLYKTTLVKNIRKKSIIELMKYKDMEFVLNANIQALIQDILRSLITSLDRVRNLVPNDPKYLDLRDALRLHLANPLEVAVPVVQGEFGPAYHFAIITGRIEEMKAVLSEAVNDPNAGLAVQALILALIQAIATFEETVALTPSPEAVDEHQDEEPAPNDPQE